MQNFNLAPNANAGQALPAPPATWFEKLAQRMLLKKFENLHSGELWIQCPDGQRRCFGNPGTLPLAEMSIHHPRFFSRVAQHGDIGLGEAYMDGDWSSPDLTALLKLGIANWGATGTESLLSRWLRLGDIVRHKLRPNTLNGARRNIQAHYDLSNELYTIFLDPRMLYSCAVFESSQEDLAHAQTRKMDLMLDQIKVGPKDHLLEIGTGWGGLAIYAAQTRGCRVTTTTISQRQYDLARQRVQQAGLQDRITLLLQDYRHLQGQFDKILSIEMFEAVGDRYWATFFAKLEALLKPGGAISLQTITLPEQRFHAYRKTCDWIQKYIFPGAVIPSLGALSASLARSSSFMLHQVRDIGGHYALTLRRWRERFLSQIEAVKTLGFDQRFIRMWEYYLCYCEIGFETGLLHDLQLVIAGPGWVQHPGKKSSPLISLYKEKNHG